jgi:hypothetical protein
LVIAPPGHIAEYFAAFVNLMLRPPYRSSALPDAGGVVSQATAAEPLDVLLLPASQAVATRIMEILDRGSEYIESSQLDRQAEIMAWSRQLH